MGANPTLLTFITVGMNTFLFFQKEKLITQTMLIDSSVVAIITRPAEYIPLTDAELIPHIRAWG